MSAAADESWYEEVFTATKDLMGAEGVTSDVIAEHCGRSRLEVEQALKHLFEQDRLSAAFYTDKPARVSEIS